MIGPGAEGYKEIDSCCYERFWFVAVCRVSVGEALDAPTPIITVPMVAGGSSNQLRRNPSVFSFPGLAAQYAPMAGSGELQGSSFGGGLLDHREQVVKGFGVVEIWAERCACSDGFCHVLVGAAHIL